MDPLVPDWRTLGGADASQQARPTVPAASAHRQVPLTPRVLSTAVTALVGAAMAGALACLLLLPSGGSVVIDSTLDTGDVMPALAGSSLRPFATMLVASDLVVDVEGAVHRPGLVHLAAGSRVGDALTLAGGFAPTADLSRISAELNLAQPVSDGLKVLVPAIGDAPASTRGAADAAGPSGTNVAAGGPVDLNHATEVELDALPGVGPATIAKIVAARASEPFRSADDLRTRGIVGDAVLAKLRPLVTVGR